MKCSNSAIDLKLRPNNCISLYAEYLRDLGVDGDPDAIKAGNTLTINISSFAKSVIKKALTRDTFRVTFVL